MPKRRKKYPPGERAKAGRSVQQLRRRGGNKAQRARHYERPRDPQLLNEPVRVIVEAAPEDQRYAPHWLRMEILERDRFKCRYCGTKVTNDTANMDHVIPWKRGGRANRQNIVTSCQDCNKAKLNDVWIPFLPMKDAKGRFLMGKHYPERQIAALAQRFEVRRFSGTGPPPHKPKSESGTHD